MRAVLSLIAGWLVPGLGHIVLKKYWRGAIFFLSIVAMTAIGLSMGGRIYPFGNLVVYGLSRLLGFGQGSLDRVTFEFGTAFIAGAGLLNYLVAIDASDIAKGKKP